MLKSFSENVDKKTVDGFGHEWTRFDQAGISEEESVRLFDRYFSIFPWEKLPKEAVGFDLGCGSGRWAKLIAPRIGTLHCIDPSIAIEIAKKNLQSYDNCRFHQASVDDIPVADGSMDFGYSLGVLHHVPDTYAGLVSCVAKLKPGAPFLLYLYYAFDNRPLWFRAIWWLSDCVRGFVSRMPTRLRDFISEIIASVIYWPLAKIAKILETRGFDVSNVPLSYYRNCSFYVMRTDALDRFGTRLEKRFSMREMKVMMEKAGLDNVRFSAGAPFWCAVGFAK